MADKDTRVGGERIGRPVDELVTGRTPAAGDRPGDTTTGDLGQRLPGGTTAARPRKTTATTTRAHDGASDDDKKARELRAEIEQTREEMSETVNAIQDRLRPSNVAAQAADSIRDMAAERTRDVVESEPVRYVRANPIPTAMIGIGLTGLAWLAFGGRDAYSPRHSRYGTYGRGRQWSSGSVYGDRYYAGRGAYGLHDESRGYGDYDTRSRDFGAYGIYDEAEGVAERVSDRAGEMAGEVRDRADQVTRSARRQAYRAQSGLQRTWQQNPLLIGAATLVLGAIAGLAVPETEVENEWMGERRDQMIEGVQEAVREKVEDVQNAATNAVDQVKSAVGIDDSGNA